MVSIIATYRAFPHSTPNTISSLPSPLSHLFLSPSVTLFSIIRSIFHTAYIHLFFFLPCILRDSHLLSHALGKIYGENLRETKFCIIFQFYVFLLRIECTMKFATSNKRISFSSLSRISVRRVMVIEENLDAASTKQTRD